MTARKKFRVKVRRRDTGPKTILIRQGTLDDLGREGIESMDDDEFNRALTRPLREIEEPEPAEDEEATIEIVGDDEVAPAIPEQVGELLDEMFQFDKESFLKAYADDFSTAKDWLTRLVSVNVAWTSAVDSLQNDLQNDPELRHISMQTGTLSNVMQFRNIVTLCQGLDVDLDKYLQYHMHNQNINALRTKR